MDETLGAMVADEPVDHALVATVWLRAERLARGRLVNYARVATGWVLPAHQRRLCDALEAVEATPGARLIVTMPPRHGKSELGSIAFPAWCLGRGRVGLGPIRRVVIAAYGVDLARALAATVRQHFAPGSAAYMVWHGPTPSPPATVGGMTEWRWIDDPPAWPACLAVGVAGPLMGRGADLMVIDDPIKTADEALSPHYRERLDRWWRTVVATRLQPEGRVVVIQTRWHEDDLAGRLLARGGWDLLHLPALDADGAALWPAAYNTAALAAIRARLTAAEWQALYQGDPTPETGALWRVDWLDPHRYDAGQMPAGLIACTAWDTALEARASSDYSAWCRIGLDGQGHYWVLDAGRRHMEFPVLARAIAAGPRGAAEDEPAVIEAAASGRSVLQTLRQVGGRPVLAIAATTSKAHRAAAVTDLAEAGRVHLPRGLPWADELLDELLRFPAGRHDDMHDAFVHALTWLRRREPRGGEDEPLIAGIARPGRRVVW